MGNISKMVILVLVLCMGGCAGGPPPLPGESLAAVEAKLGRPTATYMIGNDKELEYAAGPMGQVTHMARFGAEDKLVSYEQVLTGAKFATIKIGVATREVVLYTLGRPAERSYLPLPKLEVWSYRYKESGVWDSMMHVHFDQGGVVRMLQNGPDRMKEPHDFP